MQRCGLSRAHKPLLGVARGLYVHAYSRVHALVHRQQTVVLGKGAFGLRPPSQMLSLCVYNMPTVSTISGPRLHMVHSVYKLCKVSTDYMCTGIHIRVVRRLYVACTYAHIRTYLCCARVRCCCVPRMRPDNGSPTQSPPPLFLRGLVDPPSPVYPPGIGRGMSNSRYPLDWPGTFTTRAAHVVGGASMPRGRCRHCQTTTRESVSRRPVGGPWACSGGA